MKYIFRKAREGFMTGKSSDATLAMKIANFIFITLIFSIFVTISLLLCAAKIKFGLILLIICCFIYVIFLVYVKAYMLSAKKVIMLMYHFFGKYGNVVKKYSWKRIKKHSPKAYEQILYNNSFKNCFSNSLRLALNLRNAQIMYCAIRVRDKVIGNAVVVKNNCVYDTVSRRHVDLKEYLKVFHVKIFWCFSREEYESKDFLKNAKKEFFDWATENGVTIL